MKMHRRHRDDSHEHLWFGLALVVIGSALLLDRLGLADIGRYWKWWGVVPICFGVARIFTWRSARSVASGVSWIVFGSWFLVSANEWFGLDWGSSWPLVFVAIGASMLVRAILEPVFARRTGRESTSGGSHHA
jgi:hypothetical protein